MHQTDIYLSWTVKNYYLKCLKKLTNAVDPDLIAQHLLFGRNIKKMDSNYQFTALIHKNGVPVS